MITGLVFLLRELGVCFPAAAARKPTEVPHGSSPWSFLRPFGGFLGPRPRPIWELPGAWNFLTGAVFLKPFGGVLGPKLLPIWEPSSGALGFPPGAQEKASWDPGHLLGPTTTFCRPQKDFSWGPGGTCLGPRKPAGTQEEAFWRPWAWARAPLYI